MEDQGLPVRRELGGIDDPRIVWALRGLGPNATLIALTIVWQVGPESKLGARASSQIRDPAVVPEKDNAAPNRIWIWPPQRKPALTPAAVAPDWSDPE